MRAASPSDRARQSSVAARLAELRMRRLLTFALAVTAALTLSACGSGGPDKTKEAAVIAGVHAIQAAVFLESGAFDRTRGDPYPDPSRVSETALKHHLDYWPANPYTSRPMAKGTGPGDFRYTLGAGGTSYQLVGYGEGGKAVITVSAP